MKRIKLFLESKSSDSISEQILYNNGFVKDGFGGDWTTKQFEEQEGWIKYKRQLSNKLFIYVTKNMTHMPGRKWHVSVTDNHDTLYGSADIQSIGDFNKFIDCLHIKYIMK